MRTFRLAISGDILNEQGVDAYGGLPLNLLDSTCHVEYQFLRDQAPQPGDREYWKKFYSLEVSPEHLADLDGFVVLRPWMKRRALETVRDRLVVIIAVRVALMGVTGMIIVFFCMTVLGAIATATEWQQHQCRYDE